MNMSENEDSLFKTRFRFTEEYDIYLLREVQGQNPYEDPRRWQIIQINMLQITGKSLTIRTLRNRVQNLVLKYLIKAKCNEGKSGIEIEVTELDDLLQQIADLIKEFKNKKSNTTVTPNNQSKNSILDKSSYQLGYDLREEASSSEVDNVYDDNIGEEIIVTVGENDIILNNSLQEEVSWEVPKHEESKQNSTKRKPLAQLNIAAPTRKRTSTSIRQNTVQYLTKKNDRNYELRKRELAVQERKLILEEKKHELESYERKKRLEIEEKRAEMEEQRIKILMETFNNQQQLIKIVFSKF